ncbi:MAG: threonine ammonia-lyase [Proteobacteria bacterium]|nr:MAG: threonine ammonia-lyase [Pseudomonadota bacterium]QKK12358.1 MAG: threonine ammonia-lyase [Pseudomonadota bacterium]
MIQLRDIQAAHERIRQSVFYSPCARSETLSRMMGCQVYLKLENLQMTGSYKERGSLNKILCLSDGEKSAGVICASAGNHAQGLAHAARIGGIHAVVVMPETAPLAKVRGTRELGAEVVLWGKSYDEAYRHARELQQQVGYTFVHAFDDPTVIAGQGTVGLEILEQVPDLDVVIVPVGGGGLIAGIATAVKTIKPATRLVGIEAERMAAMKESLAVHKIVRVPNINSIADGISVAEVGQHTYPIVERHVERIVTVTEEEIANGIMVLLEREKTLAEGAGVVGFSALLNGHVDDVAGRKVVVVISGGNIDMTMLSRIIERGLEIDGRIANLSVVVADRPGSMAELARIIGEQQANILRISQNHHASEVRLEEAEAEMSLETRGLPHVSEIVQALRNYGFKVR